MFRRIAVGLCLALVLALGGYLRLSGVTYGFPTLTNADEFPIVKAALGTAREGDANPHFFHYPSLYIYMQAAAYRAMHGIQHLAGRAEAFARTSDAAFFLWGRQLTALLGVATALLAFLAAARLWGTAAGLLAGAVVAVSGLHVTHSYQIAVDVPMGFWTAGALLAATAIYRTGGTWRRYLLAGALVGLSAGTKYTGVLAAVLLPAAHLLGPIDAPGTRATLLRRLADPRLLLGLGAVPVVFLLTTPYAALDFHTFMGDVHYEAGHYAGGHAGADTQGASYGFYLKALAGSVGTVLAACAAAGALLLLARDRRTLAFLLAFPLVFLLFIGRFPVRFDRNVIALVPFVAMFAGAALHHAGEAAARLGTRVRPDRARAAAVAVVAVVALIAGVGLAQEAHRTWDRVRIATLLDSRVIARDWIDRHIPPGARVARDYYAPLLDSRRYRVTSLLIHETVTKDLSPFDYLVATSYTYGRYLEAPDRYPKDAARYRDLFSTHVLLWEYRPDNVRTTGPVVRVYRLRPPSPP